MSRLDQVERDIKLLEEERERLLEEKRKSEKNDLRVGDKYQHTYDGNIRIITKINGELYGVNIDKCGRCTGKLGSAKPCDYLNMNNKKYWKKVD